MLIYDWTVGSADWFLVFGAVCSTPLVLVWCLQPPDAARRLFLVCVCVCVWTDVSHTLK